MNRGKGAQGGGEGGGGGGIRWKKKKKTENWENKVVYMIWMRTIQHKKFFFKFSTTLT